MRIMSWVEFIQPDPRVLHFSPRGLETGARMYEEASANFVQRMIADVELPQAVPAGVREYFDYGRKAFTRGFFSYELFTVGWFVAVLAEEFALGERFISELDGRVTFRHKDQDRTDVQSFSTFGDLAYSHRRGRAYPPKEWKIDEAPGFSPTLGWLLEWAHSRGVLSGWLDGKWDSVRYGLRVDAMSGGAWDALPAGWPTWKQSRRDRWFDTNARARWENDQLDLIRELRNMVAHPQAAMLITPVEAARQIQGSANFISSIWSSTGMP